MENTEIRKQVEAIIFSCGRKIEAEEIARLVKADEAQVRKALKELQKDYDSRNSPIMIIDEGTAWKMTVRESYLKVVRKITPYMEFSKTIMETLAVVAWKQPILQSDVIRIRTNKAYDHISELEKMGFLAKEKHGRSFLLKLSQKFYDYFDLRDDVDVRKLFKRIKDDEPELQKRVGEFEDETQEEAAEIKPDENKERREELQEAEIEGEEEIKKVPEEGNEPKIEDEIADEKAHEDEHELEIDDKIAEQEKIDS